MFCVIIHACLTQQNGEHGAWFFVWVVFFTLISSEITKWNFPLKHIAKGHFWTHITGYKNMSLIRSTILPRIDIVKFWNEVHAYSSWGGWTGSPHSEIYDQLDIVLEDYNMY